MNGALTTLNPRRNVDVLIVVVCLALYLIAHITDDVVVHLSRLAPRFRGRFGGSGQTETPTAFHHPAQGWPAQRGYPGFARRTEQPCKG